MSQLHSIKRAQQYLPRIERNEFSKISVAKFPILRHFSSRHNILTIVTPNQTRSEPMETIHTNLSWNTKFEESKTR